MDKVVMPTSIHLYSYIKDSCVLACVRAFVCAFSPNGES